MQRIFAMNISKSRVDIFSRKPTNWILTKTIELQTTDTHGASTMMVTPRSVFVCNFSTDVNRYDFGAANATTMQQLNTDQSADNYSKPRLKLCAADIDGRLALVDFDEATLLLHDSDDNSARAAVVQLEGVSGVQGIAFQDQYAFWVHECVTWATGKYKLLKYTVK